MTSHPTVPEHPAAPGGPHTDLGPYLLGLLAPAERDAFERHLADCPSCTAELPELAATTDLLAELRTAGEPIRTPVPSPRLLDRLIGEVAAARRRTRRRRLTLVAAAAVLVIGGPAATLAVTAGSPAPTAVAVAAQYSATDPATGVAATVGVTPAGWGSAITLTLSLGTLQGPLTCDLVAVSPQGAHQTVTTWSLPATPYETLHTTGGTALPPTAIDHFEIRTTDTSARLLLTVPVANTATQPPSRQSGILGTTIEHTGTALPGPGRWPG
ncbi:hypothetical protein CFP65_1485 [Kitasatospora sp. MMS16-BH015]|uniref:anti-sigma factor family protein n=1 Tax=Kitasatospora sp. MMS16-BH015 TaxID=2018025 RepID=UPI000CA2A587|nr:zf-HC2 domain-containing protein [Kitasatospora sp. MMS16-BH015]AUG76380.1 hypothetical protein CFP65_1485 [Kitasatospora sp. MMS16-BH015]